MFHQQIIISVPLEPVNGVYTATARRNGESFKLAEATNAIRTTAIAGCIAALGSTIYGDLSLNPIQIVANSEIRVAS